MSLSVRVGLGTQIWQSFKRCMAMAKSAAFSRAFAAAEFARRSWFFHSDSAIRVSDLACSRSSSLIDRVNAKGSIRSSRERARSNRSLAETTIGSWLRS